MGRSGYNTGRLLLLVLGLMAITTAVSAAGSWQYEGEHWERLPEDDGFRYQGERHERAADRDTEPNYRGMDYERERFDLDRVEPGMDWTERRTFAIQPYVSGFFFSPDVDNLDDFGVGGRFTYNFYRHYMFGLELDMGWSRVRHTRYHDNGIQSETVGNMSFGHLSLIYRMLWAGPIGDESVGYVMPYMTMGIGAVGFTHIRDVRDYWGPDFTLGAGLEWKVDSDYSVMVGYRFHALWTRLGKNEESFSTMSELTCGVAFGF